MNKYVSFNIKYYKRSKVKGLSSHVERLVEDTENVLDSKLTPLNQYFYYGNNLKQNFNLCFNKYKDILGKNPRSDFNCYLEGVLAFSEQKFNEVYNNDPLNFERAMTEYMESLGKKYGFEPLGWSLHLDEGHYDENGKQKINVHAHLSFFNYDFKNKQSTFKKLKKRDFSKMQDLAGQSFQKLGFERGISKEITKKEHKEKEEYVKEQVQKLEKKQKSLKKDVVQLENKKDQLIKIDFNLSCDEKQNLTFKDKSKLWFKSLFSRKAELEIEERKERDQKIKQQRALKRSFHEDQDLLRPKPTYTAKMAPKKAKNRSRNRPRPTL